MTALISRIRALRPLLTLKVLFPALMALIVFFVLTDILYSGGRRESLAAQVEKRLIETSLRLAAYDAQTPGAVLAVSLTDSDLAGLTPASSTLVRDASLVEYAAVVRTLAAMRPQLLVVSWLASAHPTDAAYWQPLVDAVRSAPDPDRILVAYPIAEIAQVPPSVRRALNVLEGEDCIYDVNSFCTYNPKWQTWLIQALADRLWPSPLPYHVAENLPHFLPNFLLNLPRRSSIPVVSFSAVLGGAVRDDQVRDRIVLVGNDTGQNPLLQNNKGILRRTRAAADDPSESSLLASGTPLHVFWAQLAQMFVDRTTVAIAPPFVSFVLLFCLGLGILVVMSWAGQAASVALLLVATIMAPGLNALAIRYMHVYLPLFLVGYGCFLVYLFSAFGLMSFHNFRRFQLEIRQRNYALTTDLKGNFVSLISHNLNTPVAKLLGLIDVLLSGQRLTEWTESLQECRRLTTQMQFLTKSALLSSTLDQGTRAPVRATFAALLREFEQSSLPLLRRLGIEWTLTPPGDEVLFTPMALDPRLGAHAFAAMAILAGEGRPAHVLCGILLTEDPETARTWLTVSVAAQGQVPEPDGVKSDGVSRNERDDFLVSTLMQYVHATASHLAGSLRVDSSVVGAHCVILTLPTLD